MNLTAVTGVGVRIAIYVQAALSLWPMLIVPLGNVSGEDYLADTNNLFRRSRSSMLALLLTNGALLVAAFIRVSSGEMSAYHAVVILNLSWFIFLSALLSSYAGLEAIAACIPVERMKGDGPYWKDGTPVQPFTMFSLWAAAPYARHLVALEVHLIGVGVLGLLLFRNVHTFSQGDDCAGDTVLWMFGSLPHITTQAIHRFWMVVYSAAVIPALNLGAAITVFVILASAMIPVILVMFLVGLIVPDLLWFPVAFGLRRWAHIDPSPPSSLIFAILRQLLKRRHFGYLVVLVMLGLTIVSTEKTISRNPVARGEEAWGFGQILALLLIFPLLYDTCRSIRKVLALRRLGRPLITLPLSIDSQALSGRARRSTI